jgi:hypothetical protein
MSLKTFEVEFRRTSYVVYTVKAGSMEEAEFIAFQELVNDGLDSGDALIETESVEQMPGEDTK